MSLTFAIRSLPSRGSTSFASSSSSLNNIFGRALPCVQSTTARTSRAPFSSKSGPSLLSSSLVPSARPATLNIGLARNGTTFSGRISFNNNINNVGRRHVHSSFQRSAKEEPTWNRTSRRTRTQQRPTAQSRVAERPKVEPYEGEVEGAPSRYGEANTAYRNQVLAREKAQYQRPEGEKEYEGAAQHADVRDDEEEEVRQIDALTPETVSHLRKVWASLGACVALTGGASALTMLTPLGAINPFIPMIGGFVPLIWLMMSPPTPENEKKRQLLLSTFCFLEGMTIAPLLGLTLAVNPIALPLAAAATGGIFAGMSALSLFTKRGAMLKMGAPLTVGLLGIVGVSLSSMFMDPTGAAYAMCHSISLWGGLGVFSLFIGHDTQRIIDDVEKGNKDVVGHTTGMFLNVINIFVRMLAIFRGDD